jgi:Domain of unknown function (DUF5666)
MTKRVSTLVAITALAATMILGAIAIPAQAALRHIDGTVVSKDAGSRSFKIKTQSGNQLRIKVNSNTQFQRIAGFGGLRKGMAIEVEAKSTSSGLVATHMETRGGGGGTGGGGDDNGGNHGGGGADDGPNHT